LSLRSGAWGLALCAAALAGCQATQPVGVVIQEDAHPPLPWRELTAAEQKSFDLGYAVFNTDGAPAGAPSGRTDGLGPLFNSQSCDSCHNSRRRGRGPRGDGEAPGDLVMQLGLRLPDGSVQRGVEGYGQVLNTAAIAGFTPEAAVAIRYDEHVRKLADGTAISLRAPHYRISELSGPELQPATVLMPRMPPSVQGAGLLELVPQAEIARSAETQRRDGSAVGGRVSWLNTSAGVVIGRFGWQATEVSVASQTASALSREMGLTSPLASHIDCGRDDHACQLGATGGAPEGEPALFDALVLFERLHAVPGRKPSAESARGAQLFAQIGCGRCHQPTLPADTGARVRQVIHPYTDLLLHDLGADLADRDIDGNAVHSLWRTAPLWGMQASVASRQPLRLLHDGRARTIEEAILWHAGEARDARARFMHMPAEERHALVSWIEGR
jgi:CxxC motif-containing protein (DUF1111 family)